MPNASGFWSYVHADDEADHGRVAELARDVVAQYAMLTGESIDLFLDRDALEWGENWRPTVDTSLASVAFFIPVITPRYFLSAECRRELQFFARQAQRLGVSELVLPLLYVDFPALHDDEPGDDLIELVKSFQWEPWTELRFAERASGEYRRGVVRLADRLVAANAAAESVDVAAAAESLTKSPATDDDSGILDRMAAAEAAMPVWLETLERIAAEINEIGIAMQGATAELHRSDAKGKGFAGRLRVARQIAQELGQPSADILALGNDFATQLHTVDMGIRTIIDEAPAAVADDLSAKAEVCEFFTVVRQLSDAADEGLGALQGMVDAIAPVEKMSRELRPPLRALRQGLTVMLEGREVTSEWVKLIEASSVTCDGDS